MADRATCAARRRVTEKLIVGGLEEDAQVVLDRARKYLAADETTKPYAYPWYDDYERGTADGPLRDADFLAPLLLNAAPDLTAYRTLKRHRERLGEELGALRAHVETAGATPPGELERLTDQLVGALFSILDEDNHAHVRGTILAKVLHRKLPAVIPLYDRNVLFAYWSGPGAPLKGATDSTWVTFMSELRAAIRKDMSQPGAQDLL